MVTTEEESFDELYAKALELVESKRTPVGQIESVRKLRAKGLSIDEITALGVVIPAGYKDR